MSNERGELEKILYRDLYMQPDGYLHKIVVEDAVEAILAAGYRKPRTINTMEELDALPNGSVVLDRDGLSLHKHQLLGHWSASNGVWEAEREELSCEAFPAVVLWEPEA